MKYFTKGGIFAALPIVTVFAFSFVHASFASNLWSLLGIEATKKVQPRVAPKRPAPRKRPRPQLQSECLIISRMQKTRYLHATPALPLQGRGRGREGNLFNALIYYLQSDT